MNAAVSIFLTLLIFLASGSFTADGLILTVTDGKGQKTAFTYDGLGRKTRTLWDPGTAAAVRKRQCLMLLCRPAGPMGVVE